MQTQHTLFLKETHGSTQRGTVTLVTLCWSCALCQSHICMYVCLSVCVYVSMQVGRKVGGWVGK